MHELVTVEAHETKLCDLRQEAGVCGPPCGTAVRRHSLLNQSLDLKVECLVHWEHDALHLYYLLIPAFFFP